jgi:hypothetical protein
MEFLYVVFGLLILYLFMNKCGCRSVEGYQCGSCPISKAKCPDECPETSSSSCGYDVPLTGWHIGTGAEYQCNCPPSVHSDTFDYLGEVCLDTNSTQNINIGALELSVDWYNLKGKKYKYDGSNWTEYKVTGTDVYGNWVWTEETLTSENTAETKLNVLKKLADTPYYIQNIGIWSTDKNSVEIGVKGKKGSAGRHFYFSDRTGEVYCLALHNNNSNDEFPHTVDYDDSVNQNKFIQYLGCQITSDPACTLAGG